MNATRKKLIAPLLLALGFCFVNVLSIIRGIENHQTWHIIAASASMLVIIALIYVSVRHLKKISSQA